MRPWAARRSPCPARAWIARRCGCASSLRLTRRAAEAWSTACPGRPRHPRDHTGPARRHNHGRCGRGGSCAATGAGPPAGSRPILADPGAKTRRGRGRRDGGARDGAWDAAGPRRRSCTGSPGRQESGAGPVRDIHFIPRLFLAARLIASAWADEPAGDRGTPSLSVEDRRRARGRRESPRPCAPGPPSAAPWLDHAEALAAFGLWPRARPACRGRQQAHAAGTSLPSPCARGICARPTIYAERLPGDGRSYGSAYGEGAARLVTAQVLEARRGPRAALDVLAGVLAELEEHRSVLLADPGNAPWPVRAALAVEDRGQAANIASVISAKRPGPTPRSRSSARRPTTPKGCWPATPPGWRTRPPSCRTRGPAHARPGQGVLLAEAGKDEAARAFDEARREYTRMGAGKT